MEQLEAEYSKLGGDAPYGTVAEALGKSLAQDPRRIKYVLCRFVSRARHPPLSLVCVFSVSTVIGNGSTTNDSPSVSAGLRALPAADAAAAARPAAAVAALLVPALLFLFGPLQNRLPRNRRRSPRSSLPETSGRALAGGVWGIRLQQCRMRTCSGSPRLRGLAAQRRPAVAQRASESRCFQNRWQAIRPLQQRGTRTRPATRTATG